MRSIDPSFYWTATWRKTRDAYVKSVRGLCEDCLACGIIRAGKYVHHKVHLTPENVSDPNIALGFDNLKLVCADCHAKEHEDGLRYMFDVDGNVVDFR